MLRAAAACREICAVVFVIEAIVAESLRNLMPVFQLLVLGILVAEVAGPVVVVTGIGIAIGRLMEARQNRSMRRVMLREGVCPSCEYDLRALEAGEDGVTTCSECGDGWAVPAREPAGVEGPGVAALAVA